MKTEFICHQCHNHYLDKPENTDIFVCPVCGIVAFNQRDLIAQREEAELAMLNRHTARQIAGAEA